MLHRREREEFEIFEVACSCQVLVSIDLASRGLLDLPDVTEMYNFIAHHSLVQAVHATCIGTIFQWAMLHA